MLFRQSYLYLGTNTSLYTHGNTYRIIESGYQWRKPYEFLVLVTTDKNPNTRDPDYGCGFSPAEFNRYFWKT